MFRAIRWLLIPCLVAFVPAQDEKEAKPQDAAGKKTPVQKLLAADDAQRPDALIAVVEDQLATRAVYVGQYKALQPVQEKVVPLLTEWIVESPDRVQDEAAFRVACIHALRDLVQKDASEELMSSLLELAKDEFEDSNVRDTAVYALAQFGNRELVDAKIAAAMKQTSLPDVSQQYRGWFTLADIYYQLGEYDSAIKAWRKTIKILESAPRVPAGMATLYYNFACSLALGGQTEEALSMVEKALKTGVAQRQPLDQRMLETDMDIASLRKEARFAEIMDEYFGDGKKKGEDADDAKKKSKDGDGVR